MLEPGVFSFGVLADNAEVNIIVASLVTRDVLNEDNGGVDVEFLSQGDVKRLVTRSLNWCVQDTL